MPHPSAGTASTPSEVKRGFKLPRSMMTNADVARLINSDEVQSVVRPPRATAIRAKPLKKNPLKNFGALVKLNPHAKVTRRNAITSSVSEVGASCMQGRVLEMGLQRPC